MTTRHTHRLKPAYVRAVLLRETWLAKPDYELRLTYMARMVEELMGRVKALEEDTTTPSVVEGESQGT